VSARSEMAAGLLLTDDPWPDRPTVIAHATDELRRRLHPTSVWQSAYLPRGLRGAVAYGEEIPRWSALNDVTPDEAQLLESAWSAALPPLDREKSLYLRLRVDSPQDVRRLRAIGEVDGLMIVPSLDSRGRMRPLRWRWPFQVGVVAGPLADTWLATVQNTSHHGYVFDAEPFDAAATYDIAIVSATELPSLQADIADRLGEAACVIVAGDGPAEQYLMELDGRIEPAIAIVVAGPPDRWWRTFFHEMSHNVPIDAAVETIVRKEGVDALIAGPRHGMDITAAARWFAAVAHDYPQLAPLLDQFADWDWRYESGGSWRVTREVRTVRAQGGNPVAFVPPPATTEEEEKAAVRVLRRLQARVEDGVGNRREHAFAPGQLHTLSLHIGPGNRGIVADREFRDNLVHFDQPFGAALDVEVVIDTPAGTVADRRPMILPVSGPSSTVDIEIGVAADAIEVRAAVLIFQRATLLQSAQLRGPVRAEDKPCDGETIRLVVDAENTPDIVPPGAEVDASMSFHVGRPGEALLVDAAGNRSLLALGSLGAFRDQIIQTLRKALDVDDVEGARPGSEQQVELLRSLARHGHGFYQVLAPQSGTEIGPRIQLISAEDDVVPIEFVYDFGFPSKTATLCSHWRKALDTGTCDCRPREGKVRTICPLGFWGLRYIIERTVASTNSGGSPADPAGQLWPGHETLPALDRVLFAATARVDKVNRGERRRTLGLLTERLGDRAVEATSWQSWYRAVSVHKPGVLLSLPHTDEVDGCLALQIGRGSVQEVEAITREYVVPPGSDDGGPVVLLLGCSTAATDIPWQSAVAAFRRRGAAVVVGTLVETLGRQTAPLARHFAEQMWGPARVHGETIGEVLQALRRHSVASGATLGMSLVAFGQSGWLVPAAEG